MTTNEPTLPMPQGRCFISYNSQDAAVSALLSDAEPRLKQLGIDVYDYVTDRPLAEEMWQAMHEGLRSASSIALCLGPDGLGRLQRTHELSWALEAKTAGAYLFWVLLPGADETAIPGHLAGEGRLDLKTGDLEEGRLADPGLAILCGALVDKQYNATSGAAWLRRRRRELLLTPPRRARALLVGVGAYSHPDLVGLDEPPRDVARMAQLLQSMVLEGGVRWEVERAVDLRAEEFKDRLAALFDTADEDDLVFVYFSGHGLTFHGTSYLMPQDADPKRPGLTKAVAATDIRELLGSTKAWASVVVLDSCHGESAGPDASAYSDAPGRCALLGAAAGATNASGGEGLSPFTAALVRMLQEQDPPTLAQLEPRLRSAQPSAWVRISEALPADRLTFGVADLPPQETQPPPREQVHLRDHPAGAQHLDLLRSLAQTLEALMATAPPERPAIDSVVRDALEVLAGELRRLAFSPSGGPSWEEFNDRVPGPVVEVCFTDKDLGPYFGLPWEYLGIPTTSLDWLVRSRIARIIPVEPTKSALGGKIKWPLVLSAVPPGWGPELAGATRWESDWCAADTFVSTGHWAALRSRKPDLLAFQCALEPSSRALKLIPDARPFYVAARVSSEPIQALAVETVADDDNPSAAAALRELVIELAQSTRVAVVGVCHQRGYLKLLKEQPLPTAAHEPRYSFLAKLIQKLMGGSSLEDAAFGARQELAVERPDAGSLVGVPVVVRPGRRSGSTGSPAPAAERWRRSEAARPPPGGWPGGFSG